MNLEVKTVTPSVFLCLETVRSCHIPVNGNGLLGFIQSKFNATNPALIVYPIPKPTSEEKKRLRIGKRTWFHYTCNQCKSSSKQLVRPYQSCRPFNKGETDGLLICCPFPRQLSSLAFLNVWSWTIIMTERKLKN